MSSSFAAATQSEPTFFVLKTGTSQYIAPGSLPNELQISDKSDGALIFQMAGVSDGLVLLQTLGGRRQAKAGPSQGVVLQDHPSAPEPFLKVPVGDGFALAAPDKQHWLSISAEGKLVFSKVTSPGPAETFYTQIAPGSHRRGCDGPSLPSTALWDDVGHRTIVSQAVECLKNPWSDTLESKEFIRIWNAEADFSNDLYKGLREADYEPSLNDTSGLIPYYTSHFYDPDTGKNYWGDSSPTALSRGTQMFGSSLDVRLGRVVGAESAAELLGIALHYFTDLSQPMHAANIANVYGDHPNWPLADWRHSYYEDYCERVAKSGKLFVDYPRLTVEETSVQGIKGIEDLYHQMARESKNVWRNDVKPIYEQKRYNEAWGDEAKTALTNSTHFAPARVARFILYWTHLVMNHA